MNKELKTYYRHIWGCLPGSGKIKKQIMDSLRQSVNAYLEENPGADFKEVKAHFGTPQQIAAAYVEEMDTSEVMKKLRIRKTVVGIVCTAAALALLMWGIGLIIALVKEINAADGYYDVGPIVEIEVEEYE